MLKALALAFAVLLAPAALASDRVALIIGMADYTFIPKLRNTVNDARGMSEKLTGIGFDVTTLIDAPRAKLIEALKDFAFRSETADLALIYYAGHGVEVQGQNFLLPVDANIRSNQDIVTASVSLKDFLAAVDHARKMRIVVLDSCRENPLPDAIDLNSKETARLVAPAGQGGIVTATGRGGGGGLAPPAPDRGTLVAFAAKDGEVALDGEGANSPFATALMDRIGQPGLEISLMFRQVRDRVLETTGNRQEPNTYGSLSGTPFYLAGEPGERAAVAQADKSDAWASLKPDQVDQLQALATAGDARAMLGLAMIALNPVSPRYNPEAAASLLARSAAAEFPEARYELAKLYEKGIGVPENPARALELYRQAAEADFPDALNDLGFFHYTGSLGVQIDQPAALTLFRRAADLGQTEAMVNVASFIDKGKIPELGPDDAGAYLYRAIRGGSRDALGALTEKPEFFSRATWTALQRRMAEAGFYKGGPDGDPGPGTMKAMRATFGLLD
ncbi:MAG: caspase family protein [Paracoccaceae bacterium]